MKTQLGIMGLGTMGAALAENFASKGISVSLWNRTPRKI
jgi:3-hydroxyisobutyrate dehydrogenase-like beta-hydroxyacid dehydrogenase